MAQADTSRGRKVGGLSPNQPKPHRPTLRSRPPSGRPAATTGVTAFRSGIPGSNIAVATESVYLPPGGAEGTPERVPEHQCPRNVLSRPESGFAFTSAKPAARPTRRSWKHSSTPRWTPGPTCRRHPCGSVPSVGRSGSRNGFRGIAA